MPKIGLLSDSHGRAAITHRAVETLAGKGAELLLHLGDVETPEVIEALLLMSSATGRPIPARIVFGNTDWDQDALTRHARNLEVAVDHPVGRLDLDDRVLAFMHGHDSRAARLALDQHVAYLCHGHTHEATDTRQGSARVINPGALFRTRQPSVALLDTDRDKLTFFDVERCG